MWRFQLVRRAMEKLLIPWPTDNAAKGHTNCITLTDSSLFDWVL